MFFKWLLFKTPSPFIEKKSSLGPATNKILEKPKSLSDIAVIKEDHNGGLYLSSHCS